MARRLIMENRETYGNVKMLKRKGQGCRRLTVRKFTPRTKKIIYECAKLGLPRARAARMAGISKQLLEKWLSLGEDEYANPAMAAFRRRLNKCYTRREREALEVIREAGTGGKKKFSTTVKRGADGSTEVTRKTETAWPQWQAAAWYLERTHPDSYSLNRITSDKTTEEQAKEIHDFFQHLNGSVPADDEDIFEEPLDPLGSGDDEEEEEFEELTNGELEAAIMEEMGE